MSTIKNINSSIGIGTGWQQDNHPIERSTNEMMDQRLNYIHNNLVAAGIVEGPEEKLALSVNKNIKK